MVVYKIRDNLYPVIDKLAEGGLLEVNYEANYIDIKVTFNDDKDLEKEWFRLEDVMSITTSCHYADYSTKPTTWVYEYADDEVRTQYYYHH